MGSDDSEKVLIGTLEAPRDAFLGVPVVTWQGRAAKNSVLASGAKHSGASGAKPTRASLPRTINLILTSGQNGN